MQKSGPAAMACRSACRFVIASLLAIPTFGAASTVSAQRITVADTFQTRWIKFAPGRTGEILITIRWTPYSQMVMGAPIPWQWGISLERDDPSAKGFATPVITSTAGDGSGTVTLKYNITAADIASSSGWIARAVGKGTPPGGWPLHMAVTYPLAPSAAPADHAILSAQLVGVGQDAHIDVDVKNVGQQSSGFVDGHVRCMLGPLSFSGARDTWLPTMFRAGVTFRSKAAYDYNLNWRKDPSAGPQPLVCMLDSRFDRKDYYPDNDTLRTQVNLPSELTFGVTVAACVPGKALYAGKPGCAQIVWKNPGGGVDGGFTATCAQDGQKSIVSRPGRIRYDDKGTEDFNPGPLRAGQRIMDCILQAAGGVALGATHTFVVSEPPRYDIAVASIGRVVASDAGGSVLEVAVRNDGTVGLATADCAVGNYSFTGTGVAQARVSSVIRATSPQTLASLREGIYQTRCTAFAKDAGQTDLTPSNNTMTAQVTIAHPGHEPWVDIVGATAARENTYATHDYPGMHAMRVDDAMLRIEILERLSRYDTKDQSGRPGQYIYVVCLRDAAGADLSSHVTSEKVLVDYTAPRNGKWYRAWVGLGLVTWTDLSALPPDHGIIHVEAWDATKMPANGGCSATADPVASAIAPPKTALWAMAEYSSAFDWRLADRFAKKSTTDGNLGDLDGGSFRRPPANTPPPPPVVEDSASPAAGFRRIVADRLAPEALGEAANGAAEDTATKRVPARVARKQPSSPPVYGSFRFTVPEGAVTGTGSVCLLGETNFVIQLSGDGGVGLIAGEGIRLSTGTFPVAVEGTSTISAGFTRSGVSANAFTAKSGTLTISKFGKSVSGSLTITADGVSEKGATSDNTITARFSDLPLHC